MNSALAFLIVALLAVLAIGMAVNSYQVSQRRRRALRLLGPDRYPDPATRAARTVAENNNVKEVTRG